MNIFEELRLSKHKDENEELRAWLVPDLINAFKESVPEYKVDRNKIFRLESGQQPPKADDLVAYSKLFGVSTDYILGLTPNCTKTDEDLKMICEYLDLSEESIEKIKALSPTEKIIFDKIISEYGLIPKLTKNLESATLTTALFENATSVFSNAIYLDSPNSNLIDQLSQMDFKELILHKVDDHIHEIVRLLLDDKILKNYLLSVYIEDTFSSNVPNKEANKDGD